MHLEFPILQTLGVFYQTTERGRDPEKICKVDNFPFFGIQKCLGKDGKHKCNENRLLAAKDKGTMQISLSIGAPENFPVLQWDVEN